MGTEEESAAQQKGYDPSSVENKWYQFWEEKGVFEPTPNSKTSPTLPAYVIPIPPPNVTGSLHMGHALFCTLQDALIRYHRMNGFNTLWQPGVDHAGIATQTVVERQLAREGKTKHDIGREEFMKRIWAWKEESGSRIEQQLRVMGASCDWKRSKFTMDPDMNQAVRHAFVTLHEQGLIYRANRLINWDPVQQTSLSDLEVEHEEQNGELFQFAYVVEGSAEELIVATTRPETMLGDTAVAIHPEDPRYMHLHGKHVVHPFDGRKLPIILDPILVDPTFGTGAVKVTPAHDFNDFETSKRHHIEIIGIFNLDGTLNDFCGSFKGLDRKFARTAVKKALTEKGLAKGSKPHRLTVPKSSRSGAVLEPMLSTQWFVKMDAMAKAALHAVETKETIILPSEWEKTYTHFLENIQDWCVSRQLWWGHQIPAWHGPNGEIKVAMERPAGCENWTQDPDVLDTWFSSALWPFATQGWPNETENLKNFYPASDLETGYDILFFWVARMMMFGIHFTGRAPFKRILLHGMIVDETGAKMSKVKGNVIDPLDLIHGITFKDLVGKTLPGSTPEEGLSQLKKSYPSITTMGEGFPAFGADAVRFALATYPPSNKRIALAPSKVQGYKHFLNKIWNATRFALQYIEELSPRDIQSFKITEVTSPWNQWILVELSKCIQEVHGDDEHGFKAFRIDSAALSVYDFFWNSLCDWYLESCKPQFQNPSHPSRKETLLTLSTVLEHSLRLMHPFIPYITEELWHKMPGVPEHDSIAQTAYPSVPSETVKAFNATSEHVSGVMDIIRQIRTTRSEYEVHPGAELAYRIQCANPDLVSMINREMEVFKKLSKASSVHVANELARGKGEASTIATTSFGSVDIHITLTGVISKEKEATRIEREAARIEKDLAAIMKKKNAPNFMDKAPPEVIKETLDQERTLLSAKSKLEQAKGILNEL